MTRKKQFNYKIEDLISENNEELFNEVSSLILVELKKQTGTWSAHIKNDKAIIGYCKTEYPDASFAHELLHIKAELNGLKDPYVRSFEIDITWDCIRFLINQLGHHRIYKEFYDMGFSEDEFLNDNDLIETLMTLKRDVPKLEKLYNGLNQPLEGLIILFPYLVCISPNETRHEILLFKERLIKISKKEYIESVDNIIDEWRKSNRMDYCLTLARLFKISGKPNISFAPADKQDEEIKAIDV